MFKYEVVLSSAGISDTLIQRGRVNMPWFVSL